MLKLIFLLKLLSVGARQCIAIPIQQTLSYPSTESSKLEIELNDHSYLEPTGKYAFSGITTFHHLPAKACLTDHDVSDDILVVGIPFDTATSYRSGTRFGPNAIRQGSRAVSLA